MLDNLEDPALLDRDFVGLARARPRGLGCRLLITSRQPELPGCRPLRLNFLPMPAARVLLLREAESAEPDGAEATALTELLLMLGGLPLALVMTGRLMARRKGLGFSSLVQVLRSQGAVTVLTQHGAIPPDYHEKIGRSFEALLVEAWDALPPDQPMLRDILRSLGCLAENAFVPDFVLPLMLRTPPADPFGLAGDPMQAALRWLDDAQLLERNQAGEARLHPLIHRFAAARADGDFRTAMGREAASRFMDPGSYHEAVLPALLRLAIDLDRSGGIGGCSPEFATRLAAMTRLLSGRATISAMRHRNAAAFRSQPSSAMRPRCTASANCTRKHSGRCANEVKHISLSAGRRLRPPRQRATGCTGHEDGVWGCAISGDGQTGLSASAGSHADRLGSGAGRAAPPAARPRGIGQGLCDQRGRADRACRRHIIAR